CNGTTPTQVGVVQASAGDGNPIAGLIDYSDANPANHYAYFSTTNNPGRIIKIAMNVGNTTPTLVGTATLNSGENGTLGIVQDPTDGDPTKRYLYLSTTLQPSIIVQVSPNGAGLPLHVNAITLPSGEGGLRRGVVDISDPLNRYCYFATAIISAPSGVS